MFKLYYSNKLLDQSRRGDIFPLLKPFIKPSSFSDLDRINLYGVSASDYIFVTSDKADYGIIPMSLNYYVLKGERNKIIKYLNNNKHLKYLAFMNGDVGVKFPYIENLIILRANGYKGKSNTIGMPVFIQDVKNKNRIDPISNINSHLIGFCGQSDLNIIKCFFDKTRVIIQNFKSFIRDDYEKEHIFSSAYFRGRILKKINANLSGKTLFIERKKYRAGASNKITRDITTKEYYENISNSSYIVCMRGGGNFSVRLYEVLSSGRIPLYIHTNDNLPFLNDDFWKTNCIWIPNSKYSNFKETIERFEAKNDLHKISLQNRLFWKSNLTLDGYFKRLLNEL